MRTCMLGITLLFTMAAPVVLSAPPTMTPGLWEITLRTELPVAMPPMTTTVCVSKDEIAEREKPPKVKAKDDCATVIGDLSGNVLAYVSKCKSRDAETKVRITFHGDRYEGVVEIQSTGRETRQVISARRIGDCEEQTHETAF